MTRIRRNGFSVVALAAVAACLAGCNTVECGPGTKRVQLASGDLVCAPTTVVAPMGALPCDVGDGGTAEIAGGICKSRIACGPNTTFDPATGLCNGTGVANTGPKPCPTPKPGAICVNGTVRHTVDHSGLASGERVHLGLYLNPLQLLSDPTAKPDAETDSDANGTYIFGDTTTLAAPGTGLIAIVTSDAAGLLEETAVGAQNIVGGAAYTVDVSATKKSEIAAWSSAAGVDYDATGAYLMELFCDPPESATQMTADETTPAGAGVKVLRDPTGGMDVPLATAKFFDPSLATLDPALTATGMAGAAIVPSDGQLHTFSAVGDGVCTPGKSWESELGASTPHLLFVSRFHRM